jgi:cation diffusion facilitator CzcD-associated flavoprotein CzcO
MAFFAWCRRFPEMAKKALVGEVKKHIGPDVDPAHFSPSYNPWDQRVCLVPDGDLFVALKERRASVVTDHIEAFTEKGLRLRSGRELEADLVVTATGLRLKFLGGARLEVDGAPVEPSATMAYKGMMLSDVPNLSIAIGYTNASWTLKCDLTSEHFCRLIDHMDRKGFSRVVPRRRDPELREEPLIDFSSGYVRRSIDSFPRQGSKAPWKLHQNYALDRMLLRHAPVDDPALEFS